VSLVSITILARVGLLNKASADWLKCVYLMKFVEFNIYSLGKFSSVRVIAKVVIIRWRRLNR
jgi:hypothetical protein